MLLFKRWAGHRLAVISACFVMLACLALDTHGQGQDTNQDPDSGMRGTVPARPPSAVDPQSIPKALEGDFDAGDIAAATAWADQLNLADWLGPLAPLAISPFFGVACLSGLSLWGPEWVTDNALLGEAGPLCNVALFSIFALLAVLTSLPRLSKVSKPFAQAMDRLEAYAVIVILLAIKLTSSYGAETGPTLDGTEAVALATSPQVIQFGVVSFTLDTLLMIAMVINLLVVNSVKFFFEMLVWLTPVPLIDAFFELCNKTTCAALALVYATSPTLATVLNLLILAIALIAFRWAARRVKFYRTMLLDPVLARFWQRFATPSQQGLIVFPSESIGPFPAKSCLRLLTQVETSGDDPGERVRLRLVPASPWSPLSWGLDRDGVLLCDEPVATLKRGFLTHSVEVHFDNEQTLQKCVLTTSRRYDAQMHQVIELLKLQLQDESQPKTETTQARVEFA